jgi:hypothetical protein
VIEPTDELVMALWRVLPSEVQDGREPDDIRPWVATVLDHLAKGRCLAPAGHVYHPLARPESLPADEHHWDTACDDRPYCRIAEHHDVDAL